MIHGISKKRQKRLEYQQEYRQEEEKVMTEALRELGFEREGAVVMRGRDGQDAPLIVVGEGRVRGQGREERLEKGMGGT